MSLIKKIIGNKNIVLSLLIFNLLGIIFSFHTYINDFTRHIAQGKFLLLIFIPVSFWLYLFAFGALLYIHFNKKIPSAFGALAFVYCFVYGFGSVIFYPLFMIFVKGFTIYHGWNVIAHGFVGLQALLFLSCIKKPKFYSFFVIVLVFLVKDLVDLFGGGFLYFVQFIFPLWLKIVVAIMIILLQFSGFYILYRKIPKRLK